MKNYFYLSLSLLICLFSFNNETNACTSFDLNYTFTTATAGSTVTVTWTSTGCATGSVVDISLIDVGANAIAQYYPGTANSGSFSVTLGSGLALGTYRFYVQYAPAWPPEAWDYGPDFELIVSTPVELTYFLGKKIEDNSVELNWQTASEIDNRGFDIEHSSNGIDWTSIDFIEGIGESSLTQEYRFVDHSPQGKMNYYRLKQVDFSGDFAYSPIVSVRLSDKDSSDVTVFPNPSADFIQVTDQPMQDFDYKIIDFTGRTILSGHSFSNKIDVKQLESSVYRVIMYSNKNEVFSANFVKR